MSFRGSQDVHTYQPLSAHRSPTCRGWNNRLVNVAACRMRKEKIGAISKVIPFRILRKNTFYPFRRNQVRSRDSWYTTDRQQRKRWWHNVFGVNTSRYTFPPENDHWWAIARTLRSRNTSHPRRSISSPSARLGLSISRYIPIESNAALNSPQHDTEPTCTPPGNRLSKSSLEE